MGCLCQAALVAEVLIVQMSTEARSLFAAAIFLHGLVAVDFRPLLELKFIADRHD